MRKIDAPALDELVIAVPKISLDRVSKRCPRPRTRRADRLVEVPTIISYSSLQQRTSEQIIDIPVPQGRGGRGGHGGLQGVSQKQGSTAFSGADQITLTFQSLMVVVFNFSSQDRFQQLSPLLRTCVLVPRMSRFKGFSHFSPFEKSAGLGPHSGSELGADFNPWTPAAYAESMVGAYDESEAESGAEVVVEEGAATRFAAGFRPLRVCMQFLKHQLGLGVCLWR